MTVTRRMLDYCKELWGRFLSRSTLRLRLGSVSELQFLIEEIYVSDVFVLIDGNGDGTDILQERL